MTAILSAKRPASDRNAAVSIPFFDDLPIAAISATQRLYDEAIAPGFSVPAAYSTFVSQLNSTGADAPARAHFKRWIAGVQAGLIERPVLPDAHMAISASEQSYFETLPAAAMPALSELWDEVQASTGSNDEDAEDEKTFDLFFEAMRAIGHREPQWKQFVAYAGAVRAGQVERPARQIDVTETFIADAETIGTEPRQSVAADVLTQHPETGMPSRPEITRQKILSALISAPPLSTAVVNKTEIRPAPAILAMQAAAGRLLEENIIHLSRQIEQSARATTARMLRMMADEMEGANAPRMPCGPAPQS
ncbi:hypothetical protein [Rhizobium sp. SL86]|uniref:hypothetical protein n=1 Tax=Rhizobium sp. SL86 TaxID=2995148 RepID=UPI0022727822|nr:hypothetical protein [Rhizobium sp. SL86]MCY1668062.1 hypothetical protein [Rhizobium sp. SL86]